MFIDSGTVIGGFEFDTPAGRLRADSNGKCRYAVRVIRSDPDGRKWWRFDRSVYIHTMSRKFRPKAIYEAWTALRGTTNPG